MKKEIKDKGFLEPVSQRDKDIEQTNINPGDKGGKIVSNSLTIRSMVKLAT